MPQLTFSVPPLTTVAELLVTTMPGAAFDEVPTATWKVKVVTSLPLSVAVSVTSWVTPAWLNASRMRG